MRIGILTLPLHFNYGGILQAYALQTVFERMGHNVCLIEKKRQPLRLPLWKAPLSYGKRIIKNLTGNPFPIFYEQKMNREEPVVRQNTDKFINKYIKRRIVDDFSDIKETDFDAIVVGSDQIWRPKYFPEIEHAYLDFTEGWNIKRIAYAASFGTDEWEYTPEQTEKCDKLLKRFNVVSVREKSGIGLCREHFHIEAEHVLDPTMLLSADDYIKLFNTTNTPESEGTLLCYILDETPEKTALVNKIAEEKHLVPFRVNSMIENPMSPLNERIQPPVEQWLRGFYDAAFVVTDSFHACVFSILFNKPFIVFGNYERGIGRFISLFEFFNINNVLISKQHYNIRPELDYIEINKKHVLYKNNSLMLLMNCLKEQLYD